MPTHRDIAPTETDPQAPITAALMKALDENLDAVVDDDATAPKIRRRHSVSGPAAVNQSFTGLDDYSGVAFESVVVTGGGVGSISFQYSTNNGASWSASTLIAGGIAAGLGCVFFGSFDFASGSLRVIGVVGATAIRVSTNMAGASLEINAIRFTSNGTSTYVAQIKPNGGVV